MSLSVRVCRCRYLSIVTRCSWSYDHTFHYNGTSFSTTLHVNCSTAGDLSPACSASRLVDFNLMGFVRLPTLLCTPFVTQSLGAFNVSGLNNGILVFNARLGRCVVLCVGMPSYAKSFGFLIGWLGRLCVHEYATNHLYARTATRMHACLHRHSHAGIARLRLCVKKEGACCLEL